MDAKNLAKANKLKELISELDEALDAFSCKKKKKYLNEKRTVKKIQLSIAYNKSNVAYSKATSMDRRDVFIPEFLNKNILPVIKEELSKARALAKAEFDSL